MVQNTDTLTLDIATDSEETTTEARATPPWLRRLWESIERSQQIKAEREIARILRWRGIEYTPPSLLPPNR